MLLDDDTLDETPDQRRNRHARCLRLLTDFNMNLAGLTHECVCDLAETHDEPDEKADDADDDADDDGKPRPEPPKPAKPPKTPDLSKLNADLARVTRVVIALIAAENALFAPPRASGRAAASAPAPEPPRAPDDDTRRAPLREALHQAVADPDPSRRRKLRAAADAAVEETLLADPDKQTPIYAHLKRIAASLGIKLNPAKLSDEVLGMPPRVYRYEHERNPTPARKSPPT